MHSFISRKLRFLSIWFIIYTTNFGASQVVLVVQNPPAKAGDIRDKGLMPGLGISLGGGHGNLLQYSWLDNLMDRGAWQATVHGVTVSDMTKVT